MEVILGCDDFDAELAKEYGWVNRAFKSAEALEKFVDNLAERMARFEVNAVARAKACVLRAEKGVVDDLIAESLDFVELIKVGSRGCETSHERFLLFPTLLSLCLQVDNLPENGRLKKFLKIGGQTVEGESKLGELCSKL